MKKFSFYCTAFLFIFLVLLSKTTAQSKFEKGYLITTDGDTVNTEIKKGIDSLQYLTVITRSNDEIKRFNPSDVIGYGFMDGTYFTSKLKEDIFLEALVEGYLSLYRNHDQFILLKENEMTTLESTMELVEINGKLYQREKSKWKGTLSFLVSDCHDITEERLKEVDFEEKDLTRIVVSYNECKGYNAVDRKALIPFSKLRYGVNFNYNSTSLNGSGYASDIRYLEETYNHTGFGAGIALNLFFPRSGDRWALQMEILYYQAAFSSFIETQGSNRFITEFHDTKIEIGTLVIPIQVQHRIPIKNHGIILEAGFLFDQHLSADATVSSLIEVGDRTDIIPEREAFPIPGGQVGFTGGIGYRHSFGLFSTTLNFRVNTLPRLVTDSDYEIDKSRASVNLIIMSR